MRRSRVIRSGWLEKESKTLKVFRKRWIVLTDDAILAFKSKDDENITERLALRDCTTVKSVEEIPPGASSGFAFRVDSPLRSFILIASTSAEKEEWIGLIGKQMVRPSAVQDGEDDVFV